jgi:urease accessory protein
VSAPAPRLQRAEGEGRAVFAWRDGATRLKRLGQEGAAKIRLLNGHDAAGVEAVLINTAGGLAGGDRLDWRIEAEAGAAVTVSTQACERAYRTLGEAARVQACLRVSEGARLDWLPQETILYDNSALERRLDAEVAERGVLLIAEAVLIGRLAHGERVRAARFHDRWRIRRGGRLAFAEETRLEGDLTALGAASATFGGGAAYATVLLLSAEAEARLEPVRAALSAVGDVSGGASAFDGKLICRMVAQDGLHLRRALILVLTALRDGVGLPRVWTN